MKICYLAPAGNYHTKKWCKHFIDRGDEVHVISLLPGEIEGATVHYLDPGASATDSEAKKLLYLTKRSEVRRIVDQNDFDILHAHYASSYGLLAALSLKCDYFLSIWGSDVYDFPKTSPLHRAAIKYSLKRPAEVMSTSRAMAKEAQQYTNKEMVITPFGVDVDLFHPAQTRHNGDDRFIVGTVKSLESKYGIDTLLRGAAILHERRPEIPLELRIAGKGSLEGDLHALADELGLAEIVHWLGFISQEEAAEEWRNFDVATVTSESESESFGVSAVEAQASGTPLVITDIPGLMEACDGGRTAVVVKRSNPDILADALEKLYDQPSLREELGARGRRYVCDTYEVNSCFRIVEDRYQRFLRQVGR